MAFILYRLYAWAASGGYPFTEDFLWIQVICGMISIAGMATCLTIILLTKSVMNFNDGTFNWGREGVIYKEKHILLSEGAYASALKDIFWPEHQYSEAFNTFCQTVWLAILFALPGLCLYRKHSRGLNLVLLSILGIMLYLMLFEARARYLLCFTPIFILGAVIGLVRYLELVQVIVKKAVEIVKKRACHVDEQEIK